MLILGVCSGSRQVAAADGLQQRATSDPQNPEIRHPGALSGGENRRDNARSLPPARALVADWWPLLVAGVGIALFV